MLIVDALSIWPGTPCSGTGICCARMPCTVPAADARIHVGQRFCAACGAPLVLPQVQAAAPPPLSDAAGPWHKPLVTPVPPVALNSYQRAITITLVLYACGYLPGAIANTVYWWAVRRDEATTGACPPGGTAIAALFALGVGVPLGGTLALLALRLLGLLFSSTTGG